MAEAKKSNTRGRTKENISPGVFDGAKNISASEINAAAADSNTANRQALRKVAAHVFEVPVEKLAKPGEEPGMSKALSEDPFTSLSEQGMVIEPPFDLLTLSMLPEHNTELTPAIEAMEINIEGFGWRFIPRGDVSKADDKMKAEINAERVKLTNFFEYVCLEDSFTMMRRKLRKDIETTGNGYFEVVRGKNGEVQSLHHIPSFQMRLGRLDMDPVEAKVKILELQEDNSIEVKEVRVFKRFRRFAQSRALFQRGLRSVTTGTEVRWFKEFGDPRAYDARTGHELKDGKNSEGKEIPERFQSNEVVHFCIYSPRTPYGLPRYIGNLLSIFGDRAAEEINFMTFKNNNIPSMALLVSNGQLTQGTLDRIQSFVESQIAASPNYSKMLIIEAEPASDDIGGEDAGQVKIQLEPLTKDQHADALFQNYSKENRDKVRVSFRLPPIFLGRAADYTRATAESSRRIADEQVFAPERNEFDEWVNRRLMPDLGSVFHRFKTNSPNTTDNTELVKILAGAEKTGGMTPRIARALLEDILNKELPALPEKTDDFDPDGPFSLSMAIAVKNMADPAEPGQQVTALKEAQQHVIDGDPVAAIETLIGQRDRLEDEWKSLYTNDEDDHDHAGA